MGFIIYGLIFVIPGIVVGWTLNLFSFRSRTILVSFGIGLLLSLSLSPIFLFLVYRLLGYDFALITIGIFALLFVKIFLVTLKSKKTSFFRRKKHREIYYFLILGLTLWIVLSILFLSDWHFSDRLYVNSIAYDHTTRVSIIDAISRTGVPPNNPNYYPHHPVKITLLYYYWYVIASIVDQIGGTWVSPRTALNASIIWCGIGLATLIAFYLQVRLNRNSFKAWRTAVLGIGLLLVSGLDIFPTLLFMVASYTQFGRIFFLLPGDLEHWNEQITAWVGSIFWAPHHVSAIIVCLMGVMLWLWARDKNSKQQLSAMFIAGLGFSSAFGLSIWVTLIFAVFWLILILIEFFKNFLQYKVWPMVFAGLVSIIVSIPFIFDLLSNNIGNVGSIPLTFDVRLFEPIRIIIKDFEPWLKAVVNFLFLPINYGLELGFFMLVGVLWLRVRKLRELDNNLYHQVEVTLLLIVVIMATFLRSVVMNNDFGWRGWMFGQFVLLIWGVDVLEYMLGWRVIENINVSHLSNKIKVVITMTLIFGLFTTILDVLLLRTWPMLIDAGIAGIPSQLDDPHTVGKATLDARRTFSFINEHSLEGTIIQFSPYIYLDQPAGLYKARQVVISAHTLYGISEKTYNTMVNKILYLFDKQNKNWRIIDFICRQNNIDLLIFRYTDPVWVQLDRLSDIRSPLYKNNSYAVFNCGDNRVVTERLRFEPLGP